LELILYDLLDKVPHKGVFGVELGIMHSIAKEKNVFVCEHALH